jgi:hypothetical protein
MNSFQSWVLYIAVLLFIAGMLGFAWIIYRNPVLFNGTMNTIPVAQCPDYWELNSSGKCVDVHNLGKCPSRVGEHLVQSFDGPEFVGLNGNCAKYNWAKNCGASWDGITYGAPNPCVANSASYA